MGTCEPKSLDVCNLCNVCVAALHIHNPKELSAIYYVAAGQERPPGAPRTDGCLLFRAGPCLRPDGGPCLPPDGQASAAHSFMRVEPTAGTLWIFPGGVPHAVMGTESAVPRAHDSQHEAVTRLAVRPRISVAMNFFVAVPKTPRDAGTTNSK